jgi:hypothetical protein
MGELLGREQARGPGGIGREGPWAQTVMRAPSNVVSEKPGKSSG